MRTTASAAARRVSLGADDDRERGDHDGGQDVRAQRRDRQGGGGETDPAQRPAGAGARRQSGCGDADQRQRHDCGRAAAAQEKGLADVERLDAARGDDVLEADAGHADAEVQRQVRGAPSHEPASVGSAADLPVAGSRRPVEVPPPDPEHQHDAATGRHRGGHRPIGLLLDAADDRDDRLAEQDQREQAEAFGKVGGVRRDGGEMARGNYRGPDVDRQRDAPQAVAHGAGTIAEASHSSARCRIRSSTAREAPGVRLRRDAQIPATRIKRITA